MLNVADGKYIFTENAEMVAAVAEETYLQELCAELSGKTEDIIDEYEEIRGLVWSIEALRWTAPA